MRRELLPDILKSFNVSAEMIQSSVGVFLLSIGLVQLVLGPFVHSNRIFILSLLSGMIFFVASIACAVASTYSIFIVSRIIQAIAAGILIVMGKVTIVEFYTNKEATKIFLLSFSVVVISLAISPTLGGVISHALSWRYTFAAIAILGGILVYLIFKSIPRKLPPVSDSAQVNQQNILKRYINVIKEKVYQRHVLIVITTYSIIFVYFSISPFVLSKHCYNSYQIGFTYFPLACSFFVSSAIIRKIIDKTDQNALIKFGLTAQLLTLITFWLLTKINIFQSPILMMITFTIIAASNGIILPIGNSIAISSCKQSTGCATSLLGFLQMFISAILIFLIGFISQIFLNSWITILVVTSAIGFAGYYLTTNSNDIKAT